jgi:site-specific DNA-methyltransferase (cytosine-N4-specific)
VTSPPAYYRDEQVTLLLGDALDQLRTLPDGSVDCIVTSPPYYGLRDYGTPGQYGLEETPAEYVATLRSVFAEARRVLADDGTLWLNLGDSTVAKNLLGIPWWTAFSLQDVGWLLRNEIIWHKSNGMPESVRDRLSSRHEQLFLFTKQARYAFDLDPIREPVSEDTKRRPVLDWETRKNRGESIRQGAGGASVAGVQRVAANPLGRNPGDVWSIPTRPYPAAHFAVFPIDLPIRCIKAGCRPGGTVLDPFSGSGTTGAAARQLGRKYVGIDLNPAYHDLAKERFAQGVLDLDLPA